MEIKNTALQAQPDKFLVMKKLFYIFLILAAGCYFYITYFNSSYFEIRDNLIVSQASGLDINSGVTSPPKYASIEGLIKNRSDKTFSDILIIYSIGYDTVYAQVNILLSGDSTKFKTNSCRVRSINAKYSLADVKFSETY